MASPENIETLKRKAEDAGVGPSTLISFVNGLMNYATNSGKDPFERLTDDECHKLILIFAQRIAAGMN